MQILALYDFDLKNDQDFQALSGNKIFDQFKKSLCFWQRENDQKTQKKFFS